jgi:thiaminase/transcriptional activator TenA
MKPFSLRMLAKHQKLYQAITCHPLVSGMADATLPVPVFRAYIIQDYMYLKSYSEFLCVLAARSPHETERKMFQRHLRDSAAAEVDMHESFFPLLDISPTTLEAAKPLPDYVQNSQLLRETYLSAPLPAAMAAIIPCYRGYLEMGRKVASHKPANLLYSKWAALYSCPDYEKAVLEIESTADARATKQTEPEMEMFYIQSCLLEAGFLDAIFGVEDDMEAKK